MNVLKDTKPAPALGLEGIPWDGLQQSRQQRVSDQSASRGLLLQLPLLLLHLLHFVLLFTLVPSRDCFLGWGDDDWYFKSHFRAALFIVFKSSYVNKAKGSKSRKYN